MIDRKATIEVSERDVIDAMMFATNRNLPCILRFPIWIAMFFVFVVWVTLIFPSWPQNSSVERLLLYIAPALLIFAGLVWYVLLPWNAKKHYRQSEAIKDTMTLEWDEETLKLSGESGQTAMPWTKLFG